MRTPHDNDDDPPADQPPSGGADLVAGEPDTSP